MGHVSQAEVTRLLEAPQHGDRAAFDALIPLVYDELCEVAHRQSACAGTATTR